MAYANPTERAALIQGLRTLADCLESCPDLPAPTYASIYTFPQARACAEMRAEIDSIAARFGTSPRETAHGAHYTAVRSFGPVEYRVVAICEHYHHDNSRR